jgi:hypothetical protein
MTYNMIKTHLFLHQALHHNYIYNFTLNHNYKFKTIIMFKDVWVSKSKRIYVFLFFEHFEDMDPFLWNILKFTKNLKCWRLPKWFPLEDKRTIPLAHLHTWKESNFGQSIRDKRVVLLSREHLEEHINWELGDSFGNLMRTHWEPKIKNPTRGVSHCNLAIYIQKVS